MGRGHVDVSERRLRPIYDALDNGNNKKALQESDKALKKQKDLICAKGLRGLALLRLGRVEECAYQIKEVHDECPIDDATLQAMSICYREMLRMDMIAELYENAHNRDPKNEEILSALFMSYVRLHNYKKQQQTAMKLHKLRPEKNPYYFWTVMSIVMQAHDSDEKLSKTMFLPLAERMTAKYAEGDKIDAEAEVNLYLMILEMLEKDETALDIVTGPLGAKLQSEQDFVEIKTAELLTRLKRWPEINSTHRKLLFSKPDNWQFYVQYFNSLFELIDMQWSPPAGSSKCDDLDINSIENTKSNDAGDCKDSETAENESDDALALVQSDNKISDGESKAGADSDSKAAENENNLKNLQKDIVDHTAAMALTFINSQISAVTSSKERPMRGPFLAKFEFLKRLKERSKSEVDALDIEQPSVLLEQYYDRFGDKGCCFSDLRPYMGLLDSDEQKQLLQHFSDDLHLTIDGETVYPKEKNIMLRHLTVQQLSHLCGLHDQLSVDEVLELVQQYYQRHQDGLQFGKELLSTDFQLSDDYILLAAHMLHDIHIKSGDQQYVWQACVLLEKAIRQSPSNFQMKLLLIKMYCLLGAFGPCPSLYDSMEIKHIQNDSIGYTVANHIARLGHIASASSLYDTIIRFFNANHKETTEYLVQSYKYGSFGKIIEFVRFRERLQNSFQFASARMERMLLELTMDTMHIESTEQLVHIMEIQPDDVSLPPYADIRDNRDVGVMRTYDPLERGFSDEQHKQSFNEELTWLKFRNCTLRVLGASVLCSQSLVHDVMTTYDKQHDVMATYDKQHDVMATDEDVARAQTRGAECRMTMERMAEQYKAALEDCKAVNVPHYPLSGPCRTRLCTYVTLGLGDLMMHLHTVLLDIHKLIDTKADALEDQTLKVAEQFVEQFSGLVSQHGGDVISESDETKNNCFNTELLETLVLIVEFLGQAVLVVGTCYRVSALTKPLPPIKKGKKKQPPRDAVVNTPAADAMTKLLVSLSTCLQQQLDTVSERFTCMEQTLIQLQLQGLQLSPIPSAIEDDSVSKIYLMVKNKVLDSYQTTARVMLTFLEHKRQYISAYG